MRMDRFANLTKEQRRLLSAILDLDRLTVLKTLVGEPKYISQIAELLDADRMTVSYHLCVLLDAGLVQSEYKIIGKKGKAGKYYEVVWEKLTEATVLLAETFPYMKPSVPGDAWGQLTKVADKQIERLGFKTKA